jgi:hypothetical protein
VADSSGALHLGMQVRRMISIGQQRLDCATAGACVLRAESEGAPETADAAISFDPNVAAVVPEVTVSPAIGLADHQLVRIDGKGFTPGSAALVVECSAKKARRNAGACGFASNRSAQIRADGTFVVRKFAVARVLFSNSGTLDCAAKPGACVISVEAEDIGGASTLSPLTFDPAIPPVVPTASATPATRLTDHQTVTLTGRGFTPGATVQALECATGSEQIFGACNYGGSGSVTAGFGGRFRLTVSVERVVTAFTGVTSQNSVDCATAAGACFLQVMDASASEPVMLPLSFDARIAPQRATLSVQPARHLGDDQRVNATGAGYSPFSTVALVECSADALDGDLGACDPASVQDAIVTADGHISGSIAVHETIGGYEGLVDCTKNDGACVVAAVAGGLASGVSGIGIVTSPFPFPFTASGNDASIVPSPIRRAATGQTLPGVAFAPISFG